MVRSFSQANCSFAQKKEQIAQKKDERIPNPDFSTVAKRRITIMQNCRVIHIFP